MSEPGAPVAPPTGPTNASPNGPAFRLPADLDFACTQCGRCCRDKWEIRVDAPSAQRLLAQDWSRLDPPLGGVVPFQPRKLPVQGGPGADDLPFTVARRANNACVFLDAKNLCGIHKTLGLEAKPRVCQQFPFLFADGPDGVTVGLSHYCPGVVRREGATAPPLEGQLAEIRRLHGQALRVARADGSVLADEELPLAWADYVAVEGLFDQLLAAPEADPAVAVGACAVAASMLVDFLWKKKGGKEAPPLGGGRDFVTGWRRLGVSRIHEIASRQKPSPRAGRLLLRQFLSLVDQSQAPGSAPGRALAGGLAFLKELVGQGEVYCAPLDVRLPVNAVQAVELSWDLPDLAEPFRRYARHVVFRRRLLPILGVRVGLALLGLHVAAARFLARATAAKDGRSEASPADVANGIQLVEKHYATHSRIDEAFAQGPVRALFRKIAARPAYTLALLRA